LIIDSVAGWKPALPPQANACATLAGLKTGHYIEELTYAKPKLFRSFVTSLLLPLDS
jgi:hypothetical protein